ncbi:MAG: S41 family peptidase [Pseudomonadota bacterium]
MSKFVHFIIIIFFSSALLATINPEDLFLIKPEFKDLENPTKEEMHSFIEELKKPINTEPPKSGILTREELQEDIDYLLFIMNNVYIGKDFIDKADFKMALDALEFIKDETDAVFIWDLCTDINKALKLNIRDEHLSISSSNIYLLQLCGDYKKPNPARRSDIGVNIADENPDKLWNLKTDTVNNTEIKIVGIKESLDENDLGFDGFENKHQEIISAKAVVIDFRGNLGGDQPCNNFISKFLSKKKRLYYPKRYYPYSPSALAMRVSMDEYEAMEELRNNITPDPTRIESIFNRIAEYGNSVYNNLSGYDIRQGSRFRGKAKNDYNGTIIVLIDSLVASSAEDSVYLLKELDKAIEPEKRNVLLIGQNSAGAYHYGGHGFAILPNSRLLIKVGARYLEPDDGINIEGVGFEPDIIVENGQDALVVAKEYLAGILN